MMYKLNTDKAKLRLAEDYLLDGVEMVDLNATVTDDQHLGEYWGRLLGIMGLLLRFQRHPKTLVTF